MPQATKPPTDKPYPDELLALLDRANRGDASEAQALQKALDLSPELVPQLGDLALHAENAIIELAAGKSLTGQVALRRHLTTLRERLSGANCSELERLLVDRVVLSWAEAHHGDL